MAVKRPRFRIIKGPCPFCVAGTQPDYKQPAYLLRYITDRGKILARLRTGVCSKHQRRLTTAVKRARHLALLSFTSKNIPQSA